MDEAAAQASGAEAADAFGQLRGEQFINFSSYRKSGVAVDTPVWFAERNGILYIFSAGNAGKVKRLRHSPCSRVAACNAWGKLRGPWLTTAARVLEDERDKQLALAALRDKYGWKMRLGDWLAERSGRAATRAYLAVERATKEPPRAVRASHSATAGSYG